MIYRMFSFIQIAFSWRRKQWQTRTKGQRRKWFCKIISPATQAASGTRPEKHTSTRYTHCAIPFKQNWNASEFGLTHPTTRVSCGRRRCRLYASAAERPRKRRAWTLARPRGSTTNASWASSGEISFEHIINMYSPLSHQFSEKHYWIIIKWLFSNPRVFRKQSIMLFSWINGPPWSHGKSRGGSNDQAISCNHFGTIMMSMGLAKACEMVA